MTSDVGYAQRTDYPDRMREIQLAFIDDPRKAALDADGLVSELLRAFTDELAQRRKELATEPGDGEAPDTERLRQSVRRYRDLIDALARTAYAHGLDVAGRGETDQAWNDPARTGLTRNDLTGNEEVQALERPEETTYQVGQNGEAEPVDLPDGTESHRD